MLSQPLFVLGTPRSGTTFLVSALNSHPMIGLTNESRIFVLLKDLLERASLRPDLLDPPFQPRFQDFVRAQAGGWIEEFYRCSLDIGTPIWGDKHTSYGDPAVLSGRHDGVMATPCSGSCLRLIRACLPEAKFIHLHRHPWRVAASMLQRGWVGSMSSGLNVWRQHMREIDGFFAELDPAQRLTVSYAELVDSPAETAAELGAFLGLGAADPIRAFLVGQRANPTPFSSPTSDLRATLTAPLPHERRASLAMVADVAGRFGYE
jgi:hypothetical protein